jgi:tetratricopeptide (TPR) repeat protein
MPKSPPLGPGPEPPELPPEDTLETGFYEAPPEEPAGKPAAQGSPPAPKVEDADPQWVEPSTTRPLSEPAAEDEVQWPPRRPPGRFPAALRVAVVVAIAALAGGAALLYRSHHRKQVLAKGLARAQELIFPDTYAGYSAAAEMLKSLVPLDPLEAGSIRAFALAMLYADYRDEAAGQAAETLLLEPERAPTVPAAASLARAALALGRREAGTAATFAARPGGGVWAATIQGRLALSFGNPAGAVEPVNQALTLEPQFPAALAIKGDALRRMKDFEGARAAYAAALQASPSHPRAAYGLAKLALSGKAKAEEASPALERLVADRSGTPANERGRAVLHYAALRRRAGDRTGAAAAMAAAGAEGADRAWLERAVTEEELSRAGYRVVGAAPPGLQSASDDDPYEPPPPTPPAVKKVKQKVVKTTAKKATKAKASQSKASKAKASPAKASKGKATTKAKPKAKKGAKKPAGTPAPR